MAEDGGRKEELWDAQFTSEYCRRGHCTDIAVQGLVTLGAGLTLHPALEKSGLDWDQPSEADASMAPRNSMNCN
jgi:hypothetical protein